MAKSIEQYAAMLCQLLPRGSLWHAEKGTQLRKLMTALAAELTRLEGDAERLLRELDPMSTIEALEDWERELGLPDECLGESEGLAARREAVVRKLQRGGLMNVPYYISLAKALGYDDVSISSVQPFRAEASRAEDPVWSDSVANVFYVSVDGTGNARRFHAGTSQAGDYLSYAGDTVLECIINREKPAHTQAVFQYLDN